MRKTNKDTNRVSIHRFMDRKDFRYGAGLPLIEFLQLIASVDYACRYTPGDTKTIGIEMRHEMLKHHIEQLVGMQDSKGTNQ